MSKPILNAQMHVMTQNTARDATIFAAREDGYISSVARLKNNNDK